MNPYFNKYLLLQGAAFKQLLNSWITACIVSPYICFIYVPYQIIKSIIRNYKLFKF